MKFELLDEWLEKEKIARIEYLNKLYSLYAKYSKERCDAFNARKYETIETEEYNFITKKFELRQRKATVVIIDEVKYLDYEYGKHGYPEFLKANGLDIPTQQDTQLIKYYSEKERNAKVEKDIEYKKKNIIAKVEKICTKELKEVAETGGELYIKGMNDRIAKMWAILAGGYNIQCLHVRVLVKEIYI